MKIGVVGNQRGWSYEYVRDTLRELVTDEDILISGGAMGVDSYAEQFAKENGNTIIIHFPKPRMPSPERYFQRNEQIANGCDMLIAFDAKSGRAGTKNTVAHARKAKKKVVLLKVAQ